MMRREICALERFQSHTQRVVELIGSVPAPEGFHREENLVGPGLVMEFLEGETAGVFLGSKFDAEKPAESWRSITEQVSCFLAQFAVFYKTEITQGVIHTDLHLDNAIIPRRAKRWFILNEKISCPELKIFDFGLTREITSAFVSVDVLVTRVLVNFSRLAKKGGAKAMFEPALLEMLLEIMTPTYLASVRALHVHKKEMDSEIWKDLSDRIDEEFFSTYSDLNDFSFTELSESGEGFVQITFFAETMAALADRAEYFRQERQEENSKYRLYVEAACSVLDRMQKVTVELIETELPKTSTRTFPIQFLIREALGLLKVSVAKWKQAEVRWGDFDKLDKVSEKAVSGVEEVLMKIEQRTGSRKLAISLSTCCVSTSTIESSDFIIQHMYNS